MSLFKIGVFTNPWLWGGILLAVILQVLITQTPFGQTIFGIEPLNLQDWLLISGASASIFVVDEVFKYFKVYGKA